MKENLWNINKPSFYIKLSPNPSLRLRLMKDNLRRLIVFVKPDSKQNLESMHHRVSIRDY